jgi:hypothetical protein
MADRPGPVPSAPAPSTNDNETPLAEAGTEANDPGGAHGKGYSADPPGTPIGEHVAKKEAYPLAPDQNQRS